MVTVTDEMVETALGNNPRGSRFIHPDDMRAALTAALALVTSNSEVAMPKPSAPRSPPCLRAGDGLLWCCHVRGPDDLVPCADYASALALADTLLCYDRQPNRHEYDPYFSAVPALWTLGPVIHAEELAKRALPGADYPISISSWPETIPERRAPPAIPPPRPPLCDDAGGGT